MTAIEVLLYVCFILQILYFISRDNNLIHTQSQDRANFNHEIGYVKRRIESLDEKIDAHRIAIYENLNKVNKDLSREIEYVKSNFSSFRDRREVYSELLDKVNDVNKNFLYQVRDINSKVDNYSKSIDLISRKQEVLENEFKEINKHLELFKTILSIDNHNKGKME